MKKTNILLVRHGQTMWNAQKRWQGNQNSNLTDEGIAQAYKAKKIIDEFDVDFAYVSPLERAQDTIKIILEDRHIKINILENIKEINLGPWEGQLIAQTEQNEPTEFDNFWNNPDKFFLEGAENFSLVQNRVVQALEEIFEKHEGSNILIVSHGISIKVALAFYKDLPISALPKVLVPKNAELLSLTKIGSNITIK